MTTPSSRLTGRFAGLFVAAFVALSQVPLSAQTVSTFASGLSYPSGLAADRLGNIYVGEGNTGTVKKITPSGTVNVFAAGLGYHLYGMTCDNANNVYVSVYGSNVVKKITPAGTVSTYATVGGTYGPIGLAFDPSGNLFVASHSYPPAIYKVTPTGAVSLFVNLPNYPVGMASDSAGNLYVGYTTSLLSKVTPAGTITTLTNGVSNVYGAAVGSSGDIFVGEYGYYYSGAVRRISPAGVVTTLVPALAGAWGTTVDHTGNVYAAGYGDGTIRKITMGGIGVNFTGGTHAVSTTEQPGIAPGGNWNNFGGTGGGGGANDGAGIGSNLVLNDYTGQPTSARLTFHGAYDKGYAAMPVINTPNPGTNQLYRGGIWGDTASREVTLSVTNIPYACYDVYVYAWGGDGGGHTLSISNGSTTFYYRSFTTNGGSTSLLQTTSTNPASPTTGEAQYQVFRNQTGSTLTLTTGGSINNVVANNVLGLQIFPVTPPPVPVITSATSASGTYASPFSYTLAATNSPTSFNATGLPSGLAINTTTGVISGAPAQSGTFSVGLSATNSAGTGTATLSLTIAKAAATVTLGNLTHVYDGTVKAASATTTPPGLTVALSYSGSSLPPLNAGSYGVGGVIDDPNYLGSANGTLVINRAAATVTLSNLTQPYNGSPRPVTVSTNPAGLATSVTYNGSATAPSAVGSYVVAALVTNPNYTGSANGTLQITDTIPPVLTLPANLAIEAISATGAMATFTASATDNVDGTVPVTLTPASGSTFPLGNTTVNATARDAAGNTATGSFTVTVRDTTAPVVTPPANIVVDATSAAGAVVTYSASATDAVSDAVTVVGTPASGSTFPLGPTTVRLTATDAAGNTGNASFTVTVRAVAPAITTPGASLLAVRNTAFTQTLLATGIPAPSFSSTGLPNGLAISSGGVISGTPTTIGAYSVSVTATNSAGTANKTFTLTVGVAHVFASGASFVYPNGLAFDSAGNLYVANQGNGTINQVSPSGAVSTWLTGLSGPDALAFDAAGNLYVANYPGTVNKVTPGKVVTTFASGFDFPDGLVFDASGHLYVASTLGNTLHRVTPAGAVSLFASVPRATGVARDSAGNFFVSDQGDNGRLHKVTATGTVSTVATGLGDAIAVAIDGFDNVFVSSYHTGAISKISSGGNVSTFATIAAGVYGLAFDSAGNLFVANASEGKIYRISVLSPPAITSPASASGTVGVAFSYGVTATNNPTNYAATGLAGSGLAINTTTGVISGAPITAGSLTVGLAAANESGSGSGSVVFTFAKGTATVTLSTLAQTFDGTPKAASATTNPSGLNVSTTYNGSPTPPTNAGSYALVATVNDANYTGSANATLTIAPASATITLGNLTQPYDGTPKSVSVSTNPAGIAVTVTYAGSGPPPTAVGTYAVAAAITHPNYVGIASGTLQITDTIPPVLTLPANLTLEATNAAGAVATFSASANDNVDGVVAVTLTPAPGSTFPLGTTTVNATARDTAGNTATGSFTVTVRDTTTPVVTAPANIIIEATSSAGAVVTYSASATDAVSGAVAVVGTPASGGTFPLGTATVGLAAADAAGNTGTASFTVTVVDTTAPTITAPANMVIEAASAAGAIATFTASATDLVSGTVAVSSDRASGSTFALGTHAVTLTATDAAGNRATAVFSVTVVDTTAPVIAPLDNLIVEATSAAGAVATFTPSALDIVNGAIAVTATPASGSTFAIGNTTVALTATDAAGNSATSSFIVTVRDTTGPVIAAPANSTAEATSAAGAVVTFTATATDLVDGTVSVTTTPTAGSTFAIGPTTVTVTAKDAANNTTTGSFTVTVRDTTQPVLMLPANITAEATSASGASVTFAATATDTVTASLAITYSAAPASTFPLGTSTVNVTATDAAGNVANGSFTITVADTTAPIITKTDNMVIEATSAAGAVATFTASAADIVDGAVTVTATPASGSTFPLGTNTVALTAIDAAQNSANSSFTITVADTTAPVIATPADITAEAASAAGAVVSFNVTSSDLIDGAVTVTASPASRSTFAFGTTRVSLTTTDAHGNTAASAFNVTVQDTTAPVLTVPANQTFEATSPAGAVATFNPTATDAVGATVSTTPVSGSTFPLGPTAVNVIARDAAGNATPGSFTITVVDTTKPVITTPANLVLEATSAAGAVGIFTATASDIVSGNIAVTASPASGSTFALGTTTVNLSATDAANNTAASSFTITVRDTIAPVLTVPANQTLEATSPAGAIATFAATATDAVGATITYSHASGSTFALGTTIVAVTAMDAAGHTTSGTFTITVQDTTAPVITRLTPSMATLWPVNHKMTAVTLTATTSDIVSGVTTKIISVTSNESINGIGDGNTEPDYEITGPMTLNLRAERSGGNDRVYTITVEAKDAAGNVSTRTTTVAVPKNQSGK